MQRFMLVLLTLGVLPHGAAGAQQGQPEIVRGRITGDSARAVLASVKVTRGPDRTTIETTTDSAGQFRVHFDSGTGDYLVYASAPGYRAGRRRVQRQAREHEFVVDFALVPDVTILAAVKVTADKAVRASNDVAPGQPEPGSAEKWSNGVNGQVSPIAAGDLNAIAATLSNVTITPTGPSVLGSGASSNLTTLNGMGLASAVIPRAAQTQTRVTSATYDATRGGFAGTNIDVRMAPGDREFQRRAGFLTLDPLALQALDATSRALGSPSGGGRVSIGADGEMIQEAATYSIGLDVARSVSNPVTLVGANADVLRRAGVAPDSVARLLAVAAPLGLAVSGYGAPARTTHESVNWIGRFDDTRDTLRVRALTSYAGLSKDGGIGLSPLAALSTGGERRGQTYGIQLLHDDYVGEGRRVLMETRLSASAVRSETRPYAAIPGASVIVRSTDGDATNLRSIALGGSSSLFAREGKWSAEAGNETAWNAGGRRHRFKTLLWGRSDGLRREGQPSDPGTFTYASIADLAANRPSSFARTLNQVAQSGAAWNGAAAFVHHYAPTRYLGLLYGVRLEANGFYGHPAFNPALEQTLGVRSGVAPMQFHVSPRLGFTYTYNRDKANGSGTAASPVGLYYRSTTGVIRGGIGDFRDLLRPELLANASAATGLPGNASSILCVGTAIPAVNWELFADPLAVPSACVNGNGLLTDGASAVSLIDPSYTVPHSWRASLEWTTNVGAWLLRVEGLGSYDLSLPSIVDVNFGGVARLALPGEENRPVYVSAGAIDSASGLLSAAESRRTESVGRVANLVSDLRGYGGQLTVSASPDVLKFKTGISLFVSGAYTLQATRREYRGFDGAAFGDPRALEWAPGPSDARHSAVFTGGFATRRLGVFTLYARLQSGLPFTPLVQGDVNGDGRGGDRAFIPLPGAGTDAVMDAGLRTLLASGSAEGRDCIRVAIGHIPGRNACRGPWTQSLNMQWRPPINRTWASRAAPSIYLQNVLGGLDQLLHGADARRGWGESNALDPVLLVARGFDAAARRFNYDVNPRFADTRPGRSGIVNPFRLVVDVSFNLSTPYNVQQLRRALEPVRVGAAFQRRSADSITAFYLDRTSSIYRLLISESDSLFLSAGQLERLRFADSTYSERVRAIYAPLGEFLARAGSRAGTAELERVREAKKLYWRAFWQQPELASSIISPAQRELMPVLKNMLAVPESERETSTTMFGYPVTFVALRRPPPESR